jgi:predicted LPLAT superfamily acyltransferase
MEKEASSIHWSQISEKASYLQVKFLLGLFKVFPALILRILAFPVGFFYFIFVKNGRSESRRFLVKAASFTENFELSKKCLSPLGPLRHIISFSLTLVQKLETWSGKFPFKDICFHDDDSSDLIQRLENGKGAFLIISHIGNAELLRGLASFYRTGVSRKVPLNVIADIKTTVNFTRILKELNPQSSLDIIDANEIGPETVVLIEEKIAAGEMITIAGDRTSASKAEKIFMLPFLGEEAPFSAGIFYLAALINTPVYFIFALRRGDLSVRPKYDMYVHKNDLTYTGAEENTEIEIKEKLSRKERYQQSIVFARSYAALLESYCKKHPFQWYNFFDFWGQKSTSENL